MSPRYWANPFPYSGTWIRTWEPGPVLGNLELYLGTWTYRMSHRYWANPLPYSGTWTRTWEPGPK